VLPPLLGAAHATRFARAAAATVHEECKQPHVLSGSQDLLVGDEPTGASLLRPLSDHSFASFKTKELPDTAASTLPRRVPMALLSMPTVNQALRIAMRLEGDTSTMLPTPRRTEFASRYIEQRIGVDQHTAPSMLHEACMLNQVFILRDFPGAASPHCPTVSAYLADPPLDESRHYTFNERGKRVHGGSCTIVTSVVNSSTTRKAASCGLSSLAEPAAAYTSTTLHQRARSGRAVSYGCSSTSTRHARTASRRSSPT
jgi:hypothetical protein